ncbi:GATA transcription factor [Melia azedarach]|uniref:GATA transcription factor n=1 Tax=Melia azedarach TaxID=155640 RepID=A0ACC1XVF0_MELAZ|nr:GATA transcription factor [Melia azedarach]
MLYQTHHPNFFQFPNFTPIPLSATITTPLLSPYYSSSFLLQEMECIEAALKSSLRKELALKLNAQAVLDDISAVNFQNGAPSDDFSVDDLLDFSNKEDLVEQQESRDEEQKKLSLSVFPFPKEEQQPEEEEKLDESLNFDDLGPIPATELAVPADDLENLEWLSHFVEDSFSEYSSPFAAATVPVKPEDTGSEPKAPALPSPCFKTPVPAKARSKRTRSWGRVWSLGSPSLSDSSSSSTTSSSSCPSSPWLINTVPSEPFPSEKPQKKRQKKISLTDGFNVSGGGGSSGSLFSRRCSHCGVQKTPQWRAGPLGAKTLCNACGVRYKSGRLFPEYRPACSPTFSSELHSNHHRKVLEMRRKKELLGPTEPGLSPPVVPSF